MNIIDTQGIDFDEYVGFVGYQHSDKLRGVGDFFHEFMGDDGELQGDRLPWSFTHQHAALGAGQLTIWAGINGHGKSELVGQVMAWLLHEHKVCIASLEMKPTDTLRRMCNQTVGGEKPSPALKMAWVEWCKDSLYVYDVVDRVDAERIIGMVHYACHVLGCKHVVIDSLTKVRVGGRDDYDKQAQFVDTLQNAAKRWGCHIHLVVHMRKGERETSKPSKFDLRGAAEISDLADNVFIVYRNKAKEEKLKNGERDAEDWPDTFLMHVKNRHGGVEEDYRLWRHKSGQYISRNIVQAMRHPANIQPWEAKHGAD